MVASDIATLRPQPSHWPLVVMLTLMPMAIGGQFAAVAAGTFLGDDPGAGRLALMSVLAGAVGLAASVAHLGQPLRAWRIFLGWRKSWLSREALVFGAWFPMAMLTLIEPALLPGAALTGAAGLVCSMMIYVDTRRVYWRWTQTGPRFFGSAVLLGAAAAFGSGIAPVFTAVVIALATMAKLGCDARVMRALEWDEEGIAPTAAVMTARLLAGPLRGVFGGRIAIALVSGLLLPAVALTDALGPRGTWLVFAAVLLADVMERQLFFRAVDAPKMPGLPGVRGKRL
jgi:DMSO reductase anchor subunit